MANARLIKKRVSSVNNIKKITKALEMVAASKVQKAQEKAVNAKPFAEKVYEMVQSLAGNIDPKLIPLLRMPEKEESSLYIVVSTNRGLAGSLNTNLIRTLTEHIILSGIKKKFFVTVGKKAISTVLESGKLIADFSEYDPQETSVPHIMKLLTESFLNEEVDSVYVIYNEFLTALTQEPRVKKLLPIVPNELTSEREFEILGEKSAVEKKSAISPYNFEPTAELVLTQLLPFYLEVQLTEVLLEAEASEHSARMVSMKNASENAENLSFNLSLEYNKARQSAITTEINDIVTARISLKKQ